MFNVTPEYVLHRISYVNVMMYSSAMPMIGDTDKKEEKKTDFDPYLDACNPDNFKDFEDEEIVRI